MIGIKQPDHINVEILLQPQDIALGSMKHFYHGRIDEDSSQLVFPDQIPEREEVDDEILFPRADLHQAEEPGERPGGVVFQVDSDLVAPS